MGDNPTTDTQMKRYSVTFCLNVSLLNSTAANSVNVCVIHFNDALYTFIYHSTFS